MKSLFRRIFFIGKVLRTEKFIFIECGFSDDLRKMNASVNTFHVSEEKTMLACMTVAREIKQMENVLTEAREILNQTVNEK